MPVVDLGFILAVVAFGSGLSLATYRAFAGRLRLAHGRLAAGAAGAADLGRHRALSCWPLLTHCRAAMAAMSLSASAIPVFGVAWAVFWTGFLRVGAQSALLLAPLAAALLVVRWITWLG